MHERRGSPLTASGNSDGSILPPLHAGREGRVPPLCLEGWEAGSVRGPCIKELGCNSISFGREASPGFLLGVSLQSHRMKAQLLAAFAGMGRVGPNPSASTGWIGAVAV